MKHSLSPLTLFICLAILCAIAQAYAMAHSAAKRMERVKVNLIMKLTLKKCYRKSRYYDTSLF